MAGIVVLATASASFAQGTVTFPRGIPPTSNFPTRPIPGGAPPTTFGAVPTYTPPTTMAPNPYGAVTLSPPGQFGAPLPFDPYSPNGPAASQFWSSATPPPALPNSALPPNPAAPPYGSQWAPPVAGQPAPPPGQYVFPNGVADPAAAFDYNSALRLVHDVRFRHTYVAGGDEGNDLGINDSEVSVSFTFPNFLTTGQPLFITPAFAVHVWDGPKDNIHHLPPNAYSAYLDFQYATDPIYPLGAELGFRVGVYTDFNTLVTDSLRLQGLALGVVRLTPTLTAKLGVMYLDRNDIKLLPAGGLLWEPNPQLRVDIFFPQPRISQYIATVGTYEVWAYAAGEYGGGAWTVVPIAGDPVNRIDINDIRISIGAEWNSPRGWNGFLEAGYVFKRELIYVENFQELGLADSWMARAGISF